MTETERHTLTTAGKLRLMGELAIEVAEELEALERDLEAEADRADDAAAAAALADFRARKAAGTLVSWPGPVVEMVQGACRLHPVAAWREYRGQKQAETAERAGIEASTLNKIETGRTKRVHAATLQRLAEVLDCEPQQLLSIEAGGA